MYFPLSELRKWSKKTAETRRRNCAVLPKNLYKVTDALPSAWGGAFSCPAASQPPVVRGSTGNQPPGYGFNRGNVIS